MSSRDALVAEFVDELGTRVGSLPLPAQSFAEVRDAGGHAVSVSIDPAPSMVNDEVRVGVHRGIPTVIVLTDTDAPAELEAIPSGWRVGGTRTGPTIAVLLGASLQPPATWRHRGPDLVIALTGAVAGEAGLADEVVDSARSAARIVQAFVAIVGDDRSEQPPATQANDTLTSVVPFDVDGQYSIDDVLARVVDHGAVVHGRRPFAPELVTGFARVDGHAVGIMAPRAERDGGRLGTAACLRVSSFVELLCMIDMPLIVFADSVGEAWDQDPAALAAMRDALVAQRDASIPKYVVVIGRAVGVAAALLGAIGVGADSVMAWPRAEFASVTSAASIIDAPGTELDTDARNPAGFRATSVLSAVRAGTILDVVDPDDTRRHLAALLALDPNQEPTERIDE